MENVHNLIIMKTSYSRHFNVHGSFEHSIIDISYRRFEQLVSPGNTTNYPGYKPSWEIQAVICHKKIRENIVTLQMFLG